MSTVAGGTRRRPSPPTARRSDLSRKPLDLAVKSAPIQILGSIRVLVLAQLALIDSTLLSLEHGAKLSKSNELMVDDAAKALVPDAWALVSEIREGIRLYLPDIRLNLAAVESVLREHLPDWHDFKSHGLDHVWASFPDLELPDSFEDAHSRLPETEPHGFFSHLPDFEYTILPSIHSDLPSLDFDFYGPLSYLPTLSDHLRLLDAHLTAIRIPYIPIPTHTLAANKFLSDLVDRVLVSDIFIEILEVESYHPRQKELVAARTAKQITFALEYSKGGERLIEFKHLPDPWKSNDFVRGGYRFVPLSNWKELALSPFKLHNNTANIYTHLIPLLLSVFGPGTASTDLPDKLYTRACQLCLLASTLWHIFAGCADPHAMHFFLRVDYIGIAWLINASVATGVIYAFTCRPIVAKLHLAICFSCAVAGTVLPFVPWFNDARNEKRRIYFFISLVLMSISPLFHLAAMHSLWTMVHWLSPEFPSLAAFAVGLLVYASRFPERFIPKRRPPGLEWIDFLGGSHAIWHLLIVIAIRLHRSAMRSWKNGVNGELCALLW